MTHKPMATYTFKGGEVRMSRKHLQARAGVAQ